MKKYEITDISVDGLRRIRAMRRKKYEMVKDAESGLYRIRALYDMKENGVMKGDLGGLIAKESNLSHNGKCWVYSKAEINGNAVVSGNAAVFGHAYVNGRAKIRGNAKVYDNAKILGNSDIRGNAEILGDCIIMDNAVVRDHATVMDNAVLRNEAEICDWTCVCGRTEICGDALIKSERDFIVFFAWWDEGRFFTWTRRNNMWKTPWFYGTAEELLKKAKKKSPLFCREYSKAVKYAEHVRKYLRAER